MGRIGSVAWDPKDVAVLKEGTAATSKGIPLKLAYGSDFPYREAEEHGPAQYNGAGLRPSLARGGLSNVWGAAMMPYRASDIADWPIQISDLASHYEAVLGFTGLSARQDALAADFPLYSRKAVPLELSRQAQSLMGRLQRNSSWLEQKGIRFGQARIAVKASAAGTKERVGVSGLENGCVYCGLCMYGCPYGHIYNASETLEELKGRAGFRYEPDVIVTGVREEAGSAWIEGYDRSTRRRFQTAYARVYLASGVISSTRILLRSGGVYEEPVWMKDSQYFLFPLALARSAGDVRTEELHTLSQLFIEVMDMSISPCTIHLQVYSYNDLIGEAVAGALGPLDKVLGFARRALERRLLVAQGYLHSRHSARLAVSLVKTETEIGDRLDMKVSQQPETRRIISQLMRKLLRLAPRLGAWPVIPMLQVAEPGRGFHSGGTFPMRAKPGRLETDIVGRPFGWDRVHVVDATVLPSVPATTITFTVMANAHRIASESARL
jgi:choline dehydrogenase-like flavoprotein